MVRQEGLADRIPGLCQQIANHLVHHFLMHPLIWKISIA